MKRKWMKWAGMAAIALGGVGVGVLVRGWAAGPRWEVEKSKVCAVAGEQEVILRTMRPGRWQFMWAGPVWCVVVRDKSSGREMVAATVAAVFQEPVDVPTYVGEKDGVAVFEVGREELRVGLPLLPKGGHDDVYLGEPR